MLELVNEEGAKIATLVIFSIDVIYAQLFPTFYFWIGNRSVNELWAINLCVITIPNVIACFYLTESPKFLWEKNKIPELRKVLIRISKINGGHLNESSQITK